MRRVREQRESWIERRQVTELLEPARSLALDRFLQSLHRLVADIRTKFILISIIS